MSYQAIVSRIISTRPIEGADRIVAASVSGSMAEVVIAINHKINDLGVFFPEDGIFEQEFCVQNNLFPVLDGSGKRVGGGFFDRNNPRIRAQKFKRVKSNGFWCPLSYLEYTGYDLSLLKEGDKFTELNGVLICQKYYTKATRRAMENAKKNGKKQPKTISFPEHVDTLKFDYSLMDIKKGDFVTLTLKTHGTSQRFSRTFVNKELNGFQRFVNRIFNDFFKSTIYLDYLVGTRRVILGLSNNAQSYYGDETFRYKHLEKVKTLLQPGEVIMGELVGYTTNGNKIMSDHLTKDTQDKDFIQKYGDKIEYTYGCPAGDCEFYVYRILKTDQEGNSVDLTWPQVKNRCAQLGLKHVVELEPSFIFDGHYEKLQELVKKHESGPDLIDPRIHREGAVIRVDNHKTTPLFLKSKNWHFGVMEGYIKNNDHYVDLEEIS